MTGRGRAHKDRSPDTKNAKTKTKPEEVKQVHLPRCKDLTEERQNGITKERKPKEHKKTNHTEETPSVQSTRKEKTTKHFTEEINKQQQTPIDNTKAAVKGTKAKTCAGRAETTEKSAEKITKAKPRTQIQEDTTKDSQETAKAITHVGKAKLKVKFPEETTKTQPPTPKDTTNAPVQITKPKTLAGRVKSPQQVAEDPKIPLEKPKGCAGKAKPREKLKEETTETQPEIQKDTVKVLVPKHKCEDKAAVDSILNKTLKNLKIKKNERSDAAEVINNITKHIIMHLKQKSECFKEVEEPLRTGSYYENLKISNPDEFDVMLPIPVDRVNIEPFGDDGAFYSVALKRGTSPLKKFQENDTLSASKMLEEFREEVKKSVKEFREWEVIRKKRGCPAVTMITQVQSTTISLDIVLSLKVKSSWPSFTKEGLKIEHWLGTKVKQEYKRKPYYLVPKYEGSGAVEKDGVLAKDIWRVSFSHVEKAILKNHGSEKTCCEKGGAPCCRKDCLKLLKHLLSLLKEGNSSFDKFCSYHAKTTLLHACCSRTKDTDWRTSDLAHCFQRLLTDFAAHLESGELNNFFIPTQNLLSRPGRVKCKSLAGRIREECDKGFPIFK